MYPTTHNYVYSDVFKLVDQLSVWQWILSSNVSIGEKFVSPFRHDAKPGCFLREYQGIILFTDFANLEHSKFTCVHAIAYLRGVNLNQAATIICNAMLYGDKIHAKKYNYVHNPSKMNMRSSITFTPFTYDGKPTFTDYDVAYWKPRGVTSQDLKDNYVYSVKYFHINGKYVQPTYPCYAFYFPDTGNVKIYQPNSTTMKWISSTSTDDVWQWVHNDVSSTAIITKSFKDGMMLHKLFPGIDIYAFQSEVVIPKTHIESIAYNYDRVFILYDNDSTGISNAYAIADMIDNATPVFYPIEHGKDTDEVYIRKGKDYVTNYVHSLLNQTL